MGDQLETRISTIERIQEGFRHNLREMKGQLVRLTKWIEGHIGIMLENTYGFPSFSLQSTSHPFMYHPHLVHEPYIPAASNGPSRVYRPNW